MPAHGDPIPRPRAYEYTALLVYTHVYIAVHVYNLIRRFQCLRTPNEPVRALASNLPGLNATASFEEIYLFWQVICIVQFCKTAHE